MGNSTQVTNIFQGLAEVLASDYRDLPEYICEISKDSSVENALLAYDCMTSNLIYYYCDMPRFAERLAEKAQSGMTTVGVRKYKDRMENVKGAIKSYVSKKTPMENMIALLKTGQIPFDSAINNTMGKIANELGVRVDANHAARDYCVAMFEKAAMQNITNPLTAIMTSIVFAKTSSQANVDVNEFEKMWEPAVMALIETNKVPQNLRTDELRKETIALGHELAKQVYPHQPSFHDRFEKYFHDLAVSNIMRTTSPNRNLWDIGMESNATSPMIYVDQNGNAMGLFDHPRFIKDKSFTELAKNMNEDNLFSLIRKLQGNVTGKQVDSQGNISSSVSEASNIAKVLLETLMLLHQANKDQMIIPSIADIEQKNLLREQKEVMFALANPLYEAINVIDKETAMTIIAEAVKDVDGICLDETGMNYEFAEPKEESTADAQTAKVKKQNTGAKKATKSQKIETQCLQAISKMLSSELKETIKGYSQEELVQIMNFIKDGVLIKDVSLKLARIVHQSANGFETSLNEIISEASNVDPNNSTENDEETTTNTKTDAEESSL